MPSETDPLRELLEWLRTCTEADGAWTDALLALLREREERDREVEQLRNLLDRACEKLGDKSIPGVAQLAHEELLQEHRDELRLAWRDGLIHGRGGWKLVGDQSKIERNQEVVSLDEMIERRLAILAEPR